MTSGSVPHPQVEVEPLFEPPAVRPAMSAGVARARVRDARERYLSACTAESILEHTHPESAQLAEARVRRDELLERCRDAMRALDAACEARSVSR